MTEIEQAEANLNTARSKYFESLMATDDAYASFVEAASHFADVKAAAQARMSSAPPPGLTEATRPDSD